jgi:short-subunit dehydrogenase
MMKTDVIFITGSSKGLGRQIAIDVSHAGFNIILNSRNKNNFTDIFESINQNIKVFIFEYDLTKKEVIEDLNEFLKKHNLSVTHIIHNLGGKVSKDFHPLNLEVLRNSIRLNLEISIEINNYLIPKMIENKKGKIIHISSLSSIDGNASPAYSISKGALNTYIKNIARFYAKYNIMICGVIPPILEHFGSEWSNKKITEKEKYENKKETMPLKRFALPTEISPYIVALCHIDSMQSTGAIINLQGGL